MKLSILDQAPISTGQTAKDALYNAMELARAGESFGYTRYWIAEHHDLPGIASSAPEVMLGFIGAHTSTIRIGSGAVLLPHYKPYKVAEVFNLLSVLFPGRIDLGIGRAPGGSAEATTALSGQFLQKVYKMPELVEELLHFLYHDFPEENIFSRVKAAPVPADPPHAWLLGTSGKSAVLAARSGMSYAFGQFMSEQDGAAILKQYEQAFTPRKPGDAPQTLLTVSAVCAETAEKAEEVAWSSLIWQLQAEKGGQASVPSIEEAKSYPLTGKDKEKLAKMKQNMVIGNPQQVRAAFTKLQEKYGTDELMIFTIAHSFEDRIASYRYIAEEVLG